MHAQSLSHVQLFVTPWSAACQAPRSTGFSRQDYWRGLPFPPPGILPTQGSNPRLLRLLPWHVDSLLLCHLRTLYCTLIRLQQSVNRAFTCAGKPELSQSLLYCNIPITVAVWYHTHSISKVCPCIYVSVCLSNSS